MMILWGTPQKPDRVLQHSRLPLLILSKPMRYSALALGSLWERERQPNESTFHYLDLCYKNLRRVLKEKDGVVSVALFYTCYTLLKCASELEDSTAVICHLRAMHTLLQRLESDTSIPEWERRQLDLLWLDGLTDLLWRLRRAAIKDRQILGALLKETVAVLDSHPLPTFVTHRSSWSHHVQLQTYFICYFAFYLALIDESSPFTRTTLTVESTSQVIINLVRQIKQALHQRDSRAHDIESYLQADASPEGLDIVSLYSTYSLIEQLVVCREADSMEDGALNAKALVRYRMSVKLVNALRDRKETIRWELWGGVLRNLFMTGLILRKSSFPIGTLNLCSVLRHTEHAWIAREIRQYQNHFAQTIGSGVLLGRETEGFLELLPEFLNRADQCVSWKDVWTMTIGNLSLWQCFSFLLGVHISE